MRSKKPTPVRIDPDVYEELEKISEKDERSIKKTANRFLRKAIKDRKEKQ